MMQHSQRSVTKKANLIVGVLLVHCIGDLRAQQLSRPSNVATQHFKIFAVTFENLVAFDWLTTFRHFVGNISSFIILY